MDAHSWLPRSRKQLSGYLICRHRQTAMRAVRSFPQHDHQAEGHDFTTTYISMLRPTARCIPEPCKPEADRWSPGSACPDLHSLPGKGNWLQVGIRHIQTAGEDQSTGHECRLQHICRYTSRVMAVQGLLRRQAVRMNKHNRPYRRF